MPRSSRNRAPGHGPRRRPHIGDVDEGVEAARQERDGTAHSGHVQGRVVGQCDREAPVPAPVVLGELPQHRSQGARVRDFPGRAPRGCRRQQVVPGRHAGQEHGQERCRRPAARGCPSAPGAPGGAGAPRTWRTATSSCRPGTPATARMPVTRAGSSRASSKATFTPSDQATRTAVSMPNASRTARASSVWSSTRTRDRSAGRSDPPSPRWYQADDPVAAVLGREPGPCLRWAAQAVADQDRHAGAVVAPGTDPGPVRAADRHGAHPGSMTRTRSS